MIDVKEHLYSDDPNQGHPDVQTRLKDACYFFIGNGHIFAAVQIAPFSAGTALGLLIMNPDKLGKKRDTLTIHSANGLQNTMITFALDNSMESLNSETLRASWYDGVAIPAVKVEWQSQRFQVAELFYCPDLIHPVLVRELHIKNIAQRAITAVLKTGVLDEVVEIDLSLTNNEETRIFLRYGLDAAGKVVRLDAVERGEISDEAIAYWNQTTKISSNSALLNHYFNASKIQQATAISRNSIIDASIWQYNGEWVRDHSMMAVGLILAGHHEMARKLIIRLFRDFVTDQGDTVDSSQKRDYAEVELDQNGILLYTLRQYVCWTGDVQIIQELWQKIKITAEFPLQAYFRHTESGLLANQREYWERHSVYGIEKGMELTYQLWVSMGLSAAASLARMISKTSEAMNWEDEAARIKSAMLNDARFKLIDERGFIKRRGLDGAVQETIQALLESQLPGEAPLAKEGEHFLNPDTSAALPIALEFIPADSPVAIATMNSLELLWNQSWEDGGYGRYHFSSEPDSAGAWPFASLFLARAYVEMGDYEKVWRILNWMNAMPGSQSGAWFEFYGKRLAPPFPQVGVTPWTWAEMLMLLIHHIVGVRPEIDYFTIRPKLLPGIDKIEAIFPLRNFKLNLTITRALPGSPTKFRSNGEILKASSEQANIRYADENLWVEADVA